ncbi:delta-aminolevulinic acid dehydratase [Halioglobus maricola]|uniref:Delta-aminolevulinic acid dehydratase n=1 Tax=Halioglobus maricola TaxID=2601894 RepID=A0A5P9NGE7_9GAMM|nr:delta-aminolevulinic acid dehydratase [Halioglobus maricola]QFU74619.1 delta-aminolevulinic acid dehydratase [Halioglobus maricola]
MTSSLYKSFSSLKLYCESEAYRGWDPYDGLNSKIFQATPLKHWDVARLILIQAFKRSPINFRTIFLVPKEYNAKGIGLFLNGYCNLYRLAEKGDERFGTTEEILLKIDELAQLLLSLRTQGYSGNCWGYNFDWQARRLFLFPAYTPTVVATCFCATALFEAYDVTGNQRYLEEALTSGSFILNDLGRSECEGGLIFAYSPLEGNDTVYNASLLGAKLLSYCYHYSGDEEFRVFAKKAVNAACKGQAKDGSWVYGLLPVQSWIDSFHTGYNLDAISVYADYCGDDSYAGNLKKGLDFYLENFFEDDGTPKYYHDKTYPIDIHCPGQLWVTLSKLGVWQENKRLSEKTFSWTKANMQDRDGFFYYQLKKGLSSKISYMRWSNAFMFNALTYYLLENTQR